MAGRFSAPAAGDGQQPRMREIAATTMAMSGWSPDAAVAETGANAGVVGGLRKRMGQPSLLTDEAGTGMTDDTKTKLGG
jgi:hypothetical protein